MHCVQVFHARNDAETQNHIGANIFTNKVKFEFLYTNFTWSFLF